MVESIGSNEPIDGRIAYVEFARAETRRVDGQSSGTSSDLLGIDVPFTCRLQR